MSILLPENAVTVVRGSSKTLALTVKDKDGNPFDLTGVILYFTVKKVKTDQECVIQKISTDSAQIEIATPPTQGTAKIFLQPSDTNKDPGKYCFDIWVVLSSGARFVVVPPSVFEIVPGVTVLAP